jgi:hypothetical protein
MKSNYLCLAALALVSFATTAPTQTIEQNRRVIVLTDIGNEPDDSESFVRFLLYTNHFDVEALVATTSTWQRQLVQPQLLRERVAAYATVLSNLRRQAPGYPDAALLQHAIIGGSPVYGMAGVGKGKESEASRRIIEVIDRPDPRPVYVAVWGGAADLAQALWTVRATRSPEMVKAFVARLRVYSISDQDDAGPWARQNFPTLFWIASVHGWGQYSVAAWTGISGDVLRPDKWPGSEMVSNEWLEKNIRRGPLGALYPPHVYLMEGDTPSFLGLIANGVNEPEHPEWGGWGGRYVQAYEGAGHRADSPDRFVDVDGTRWSGNQASVFRWRRAFQNDFAARIAWSLTAQATDANHNPEVVLNGVAGRAPLLLAVKSGATVRLTAAGTRDPDGDQVSYRWWQYAEPSAAPGDAVPVLMIDGDSTAEISFVAPAINRSARNMPPMGPPPAYHIVLEVTDAGTPALTSYRRAIINMEP